MFKAEPLQTVYEEKSISVADRFGKLICYLSIGLYVWKNDTATSEK